MTVSRRETLKGLALGAGLSSVAPILRIAAQQAVSDEQPAPKRFVFVLKSSGIDRANLVPTNLDVKFTEDQSRGELVDVALDSETLPEILEPFQSLLDRVTIVQGLSGQNYKGNHTAGYGALSCRSSERVPIAPTLDYILGEHFSRGPYPMYAMAMNGSLLGQNTPPEDGYCYPNISAKGESQAVPFQASPEKAFMELFGYAVLPEDEAQRKLDVRKNLMDFLGEDARRIEQQLNSDERARFQNYTTAFESLRAREVKRAEMADRIQRDAPEFTDNYSSQVETIRQECQFNIATSALITGLTNVVTLRPDTLGTVYSGLGFRAGLHAIGHGGEAAEGIASPEARKMIDAYHLEMIAAMAKRLSETPEGNGSMLDNTLIVYMSCSGGSHHGGQRDWPFVLVGGLGDRMRTGRYLQYPTYLNPGHKTIANLYLAIQEAARLQTGEQFGQPDSLLRDLDIRGPLDELLA